MFRPMIKGRVAAAGIAVLMLIAGCTTSVAGSASRTSDGPAVTATTPGGTSSGSASATMPDYVPLPGLLDPSDELLADDPAVRTGQLDNGLKYYVRQNDRPGGKAQLWLAIKAGSVDEFGTSTGVAHFVEHMLFNGTEKFPKNQLIDTLRGFGASFGADVNAYTSFDETVYTLDVPNDPEPVDAGLTILQEWLSHATFDPAEVEAERGVVLDEWRRNQDVDGRLFGVALDLYFAGTPYRERNPIGSDTSISTVSRDELKAYYDAWYRPDNAAVIVVGDIDPAAMEQQIKDRFGPAVPHTAELQPRPDTTIKPYSGPGFALHSDPDQTTVDVEVDLPLPAFPVAGTAGIRAAMLDRITYDILIRRLKLDLATGAPFDSIGPGSNSYVRGLDAPALFASTTADNVQPTLQALLDEYERTYRFGFTAAELELARADIQADLDAEYAGRSTIQDHTFARSYRENFLSGEPIPDAELEYQTSTAILAALTPEALNLRFQARWTNTHPQVIISTPEALAEEMPSEDTVLAAITDLPNRELEPRDTGVDLPDELMDAPEAIAPASREALAPGFPSGFTPVRMTFPNGVTVMAVNSGIAEGQLVMSASSPGGLSLIADQDVVDGLYAGELVTHSGVGAFNQAQLEQVLAGESVSVQAWSDPYSDNFYGSGATADLESMLQLLHLYMTQPRVDEVALTQVQHREGPVIEDPSTDPGRAAQEALNQARYGHDLRYADLPTPAEFAGLDAPGALRVWQDRHSNASDWTFAFSGDLDINLLADLSGRYLATLPGTGITEQWLDLAPDPPAGVTAVDIEAGLGDTASVEMLFTSPVAAPDRYLRGTADVVQEVLSARLTDVVREQLGQSYSPQAYTWVAVDPDPVVHSLVKVSGAPDSIASVAALIAEQLNDLAVNGPTEHEFTTALAQVREQYSFINDQTFVNDMITIQRWPSLGWTIEETLDAQPSLDTVSAQAVQDYIAVHIGTDQYIQVITTPR